MGMEGRDAERERVEIEVRYAGYESYFTNPGVKEILHLSSILNQLKSDGLCIPARCWESQPH